MKTYEIALDRAGRVFHPFPVCDKSVGAAGDIFFYPSCENPLNVDICLRANSSQQAKEKAIVLMENIEGAGLWGVDGCLKMAWYARIIVEEELLSIRGPFVGKAECKRAGDAEKKKIGGSCRVELHEVEMVYDCRTA